MKGIVEHASAHAAAYLEKRALFQIHYFYLMKPITVLFCLLIFSSCSLPRRAVMNNNHQQQFWDGLKSLCGNAYRGQVISAPENDTVFRNKELYLHIKSCEDNRIRTPFVVGSNRSRTFIITKLPGALQLQHDHRHSDGIPDSITLYGGTTNNSGSPTMQIFPADQHTANILPAAAGNVWWFDMQPGKWISYNLRRMGTDRIFTIRFDLTQPVQPPEAPWGWKD